MKLPFIFKNNNGANNIDHLPHQQWQWPSCKQRKLTNNSVSSYSCDDEIKETPKACFSKSSSDKSDDSLESLIKGVQSSPLARLFFEPQETKSICRNENKVDVQMPPFKGSVAVVMDSEDPHGDFKKSMEEMIGSNGLNDLESLEKLLGWYLKMNDERHHGFIVEAFVDMFLELAASSSSSSLPSSSVFSAGPSLLSCSSALSTGGQRE